MLLLDGKAVANHLRESLKTRVEAFQRQAGRAPHLTVVLVGDDKASQVYVRNKHFACKKAGIESSEHSLPGTISQEELEETLRALNSDDGVDGILVQLPLPKGLKPERVLELLRSDKDADGLTYSSLGYLWAGRPIVKPCTPSGVMRILEHYEIPVAGRRAVVVGRSNIVGKPMAHLLSEADATVTLCHSKTKDMRSYTREADIVVVAAGKARLLGREDFKKDAVVIDVGMHGTGSGELCGDVRFEELEGHVAAATPVPGGVGPMTIACLLENTVTLAEKRFSSRKR
ncbi:MAG: bifunctional methylenetetrahydrofolate dehydrogenase/methenyltetrahydrofolate cyclohydrolase FolD [Bdellovibrionaceae bacterium]|nr:bifunctional methylenetetrahydrofolate dehydrogenase/methenyltetrahydrofolate cyclohydrolase FolD [Pseudobdellovibrionaceae bacterium]MBX3034406.1 bifunctional methylenetetrahydrofolate dehydrogenase/methenyltetrahydrofolate cyclohydrolase FolD [Pseudobdellovibrionaceae bacterium]